MKKLNLFTGQELMSIASVVKCKFFYVPIPISVVEGGGSTLQVNKTREKVFDKDAIDTAENEGWPTSFGICGDRSKAGLNKEEASSSSALSRIKKAFGKFKGSFSGVKEISPEKKVEKYYIPKDKAAGFSRPPYID